ncbi:MAG: hypothetical protein ACI9FN_003624 [Saprospiraceae bacterium]|jgi:uncharacterized protein (DUF58 family)
MPSTLYFQVRWYITLSSLILGFTISYALPWVFLLLQCLLIGFIIITIFDYWRLKRSAKNITIKRLVTDQLSLSDIQEIKYSLQNDNASDVLCTIIDELPYQLQDRSFEVERKLKAKNSTEVKYAIRPTERGEFCFGNMHLYLSSTTLGLVEYRKTIKAPHKSKVYPSFIQMKKYYLQIFKGTTTFQGIRKIRKLGQNDEFENIRTYVQGDNVKSINWKATSRNNVLMTNHFQDTRSQQVYCIIDKGRSMKMPFDNLTLLDYAINSSLVLSNIVLKKYDKAGLITFNNQLNNCVSASSHAAQIQRISDTLYAQETNFKESNYEKLYFYVRRYLKRRSILLLFTNFEDTYNLRRQLPYLKGLNRHHLLVVIFFSNTGLIETIEKPVTEISDIYIQTFAKKQLMQKYNIENELASNGIQIIVSTPDDLSMNTINKYLEIKAKRML